ncbi:MAG: energy-coupled thiamine transporter ThiT, partial [Peptococcaceae bacterium]|nr:energy-coupled thiamine transporter ThiT [Peptococcaceae bacterium]
MRNSNVKTLVMIALFAAIAFVLNSIKLFTMPYGGSVSLCSMMPVMLLAVLSGNRAGLACGLVLGLLSMLNGVYIVHPAQFLLDYILPYTFLGLAGFWGYQHKGKVFLGAVIAVVLSV